MREYRKILRNREARIVRRLRRKQWCSQVKPMMSGGNIHYEMSGQGVPIIFWRERKSLSQGAPQNTVRDA